MVLNPEGPLARSIAANIGRRAIANVALSEFHLDQWNQQRPHATGGVPDFTFKMDTRDPTRLVAVFYDWREGGVNLHLLYNDEVLPLAPGIDDAYRNWREDVFGRSEDIETIMVNLQQDPPVVRFPRTFSQAQPYYTSLHFRGARPTTERVIYIRTWNHMMSTRPNVFAKYRDTSPLFINGTRDDAEDRA